MDYVVLDLLANTVPHIPAFFYTQDLSIVSLQVTELHCCKEQENTLIL